MSWEYPAALIVALAFWGMLMYNPHPSMSTNETTQYLEYLQETFDQGKAAQNVPRMESAIWSLRHEGYGAEANQLQKELDAWKKEYDNR